MLLQQVGTTGEIHDYSKLIAELKARKVVVSVAADFMALVLLTAPGKQGADIVFGSAQRFGVPMGYGGPHAAFFAAKDEFKRSMPGRIIGVSKDAAGNTALRMAMQTREQHIRREKANSNICTSQVLLANIASLYAVFHGPEGLKRIASRIHRLTDILADGLQKKGSSCAMPTTSTLCAWKWSTKRRCWHAPKRWKLTCAATSITPLASPLMKQQPAKMC